MINHAVVDAFVVGDDGRFLLIKEKNGTYNFPGGNVESDETIDQAVIREVQEESGYRVALTGVVGWYQSVFNDLNVAGWLYCAEIVDATLADHTQILWVTRAEFDQLAADGKLANRYLQLAVNDFLLAVRCRLTLSTAKSTPDFA